MDDTSHEPHGAEEPRIEVLIVDDNPLNRALVEAILEKLGLPAVSADSGAAAVALASAQAFELIIMDSRMPGLDGDETARRIRAEGPSRQAIILRWTTEDEDRLNATLYDGDLPKPLTCSPLVAAISLATRRARNRADQTGGLSHADDGEACSTH